MRLIRQALAWIAYQRALRAYKEAEDFRRYAVERTEQGAELERQSTLLRLEAMS